VGRRGDGIGRGQEVGRGRVGVLGMRGKLGGEDTHRQCILSL